MRFLFPVSSFYRVQSQQRLLFAIYGFLCRYVEKHGVQSLKTANLGIRTSLKSRIYFQFVQQTIGDDATTFPSRMQNFVKIGKELRT